MRHLPLGKRRHVAVRLYWFGFYFQIRRGLNWTHFKVGAGRRRHEMSPSKNKDSTRPRVLRERYLFASKWGTSKGVKKRNPLHFEVGVKWGRVQSEMPAASKDDGP